MARPAAFTLLADLHPHRVNGTSDCVWHPFDKIEDLRPILKKSLRNANLSREPCVWPDHNLAIGRDPLPTVSRCLGQRPRRIAVVTLADRVTIRNAFPDRRVGP